MIMKVMKVLHNKIPDPSTLFSIGVDDFPAIFCLDARTS